MNARESLSVVESVAPSSTEEYTHTFDRDATIERIDCHTFTGQRFDLQYRYKIRYAEGHTVDLMQSLGEDYLAGEDVSYSLPVRREVSQGDELVIEVRNINSTYEYTADTQVVYDEELLGSLIGAIKGKVSL